MNSLLPESPAAAAAATTTNGSHQQLGCTRYESQKRRDWNTFGQFLRNHYKPAVSPSECGGAHVLEFLRYLDQFGKTKVHCPGCPFFGLPCPPSPCPCPLRQAWGSLDSLVGRLRAALNDHVNSSESDDTNTNPFAAPAVRLYLREVRDEQSKARGVSYCKKKRKHRPSDMSPDATNSPVELPPLPPPSSPDPIHRYN